MRTIALLGLTALLPFTAVAQRDWARNPAIPETDTTEDIFAIGDAHSDYVRLARAMRAAGLINEQDHWTAGKAVLVTTGDMIDKGPRALDVLHLLMKVRDEAGRAGGKVFILSGNHEAEFLADPEAPKGKEFADQLRAAGISPAETGKCKGEVGVFLCSLAFGARVNDWFFSHAGNTGGRTMSQLKSDLQTGLDADGYDSGQLLGKNSLLEAKLDKDGPGGKPWTREGMPQRSEESLLVAYSRALGVAHIVEGHKPSKVEFADGTERRAGEMFQRFGLLFLIDTGMSEGVDDSNGAVLGITGSGTTATAICPDGTKTVIWDSRSKQNTGRAGRCLG